MTNPFISLEQAATQMHRGAGPESLIQAAPDWSVVAQKLATAAEEMLSAITWCEGQYWQSPAAQQMRDDITSVTQGLKNNAVVAGQIKTAATWVAAAFNTAQAATPTPQHVANNRESRAQWAALNGVLGLNQSVIAELDTAYEVMWLHSMTAHAIYYHDTSHALERGEQTWWTPHQQPAGAPTTAEDHLPTHNAPNIPAQIEQHHDTAALCRIYALDHAIETIKHQEEYKKQNTYAQMCKGLADHDKATAELCNKMAQLSREVAQLHQDFPRGLSDIPDLAQKYVDIATIWKQTRRQMQETINAYHAASTTQPHLQEIKSSLSEMKGDFGNAVETFFRVHDLDLYKPNLRNYTNSLQRFSAQITNQALWEASMNERKADVYAHAAKGMQDCARDRAEEAGTAGRAAYRHAQSMTDRVHDFTLLLQTAALVDNPATTPAGSSA